MQIICLGQNSGIGEFLIKSVQQGESGFSFAPADGLKRHHIKRPGLDSGKTGILRQFFQFAFRFILRPLLRIMGRQPELCIQRIFGSRILFRQTPGFPFRRHFIIAA